MAKNWRLLWRHWIRQHSSCLIALCLGACSFARAQPPRVWTEELHGEWGIEWREKPEESRNDAPEPTKYGLGNRAAKERGATLISFEITGYEDRETTQESLNLMSRARGPFPKQVYRSRVIATATFREGEDGDVGGDAPADDPGEALSAARQRIISAWLDETLPSLTSLLDAYRAVAPGVFTASSDAQVGLYAAGLASAIGKANRMKSWLEEIQREPSRHSAQAINQLYEELQQAVGQLDRQKSGFSPELQRSLMGRDSRMKDILKRVQDLDAYQRPEPGLDPEDPDPKMAEYARRKRSQEIRANTLAHRTRNHIASADVVGPSEQTLAQMEEQVRQLEAEDRDLKALRSQLRGPQTSPPPPMESPLMRNARLRAQEKAEKASQHLGEVRTQAREIAIECWDHGTEDGDIVDILLNGQQHQRVNLLKARTEVVIPLQSGVNTFEVKAVNEGDSSPNTASFIVKANQRVLAEKEWNLKTGENAILIVIRE